MENKRSTSKQKIDFQLTKSSSRSPPFLDEERTILAKGEIGKYQLDLNANHPALLHWKHQEPEVFFQNEQKTSQFKGSKLLRSVFGSRYGY